MDTYNFPEDIKVRRFCLTLTGEARLWYESLKPIDMDWNALQTHFRQQYSKFGSSREHISMYGDRLGMMKMKTLLTHTSLK